MARILFLMRYPLHRYDNLLPKFDGQMAAVEELGHQAFFLGWDPKGVWLCRREENAGKAVISRSLLCRSPLSGLPGYEHTFLFADLMRGLKKAVAVEPFDGVYMRYMTTFRNAVCALRAAKAGGAKLILEHPTYPFVKGKKTSFFREPVFRYADRVFRSINPMIDLYALIGDPCDGALDGRPAMNIANGVDVNRFPLHESRGAEGGIGMLALASMIACQGYDRILRAMAAADGDAILYMAGGEGDGSLAQWKALAQELGLGNRVVFCGQVNGPALDELASRCDIGVGGLGTYRMGQYSGRTLKLREYMARGLPFVYAVDDPDLPKNCDFCLQIPNDDSLPDMKAILAFARRVKADPALPSIMRAYARDNMSWTKEMKAVLERVGIPCPER